MYQARVLKVGSPFLCNLTAGFLVFYPYSFVNTNSSSLQAVWPISVNQKVVSVCKHGDKEQQGYGTSNPFSSVKRTSTYKEQYEERCHHVKSAQPTSDSKYWDDVGESMPNEHHILMMIYI